MNLGQMIDLNFVGNENSGCDPAVAEAHGTRCGRPPKDGNGVRQPSGVGNADLEVLSTRRDAYERGWKERPNWNEKQWEDYFNKQTDDDWRQKRQRSDQWDQAAIKAMSLGLKTSAEINNMGGLLTGGPQETEYR